MRFSSVVLPRPGRPHEREELGLADVEGEVVEDVDRFAAAGERLVQVADLQRARGPSGVPSGVTRRGKRFPTGYEMAGRTGRREERSEVRSHLLRRCLSNQSARVERSLPISNQKWPFPFLTMRSQVTLHALSRAIRASDC